MKFLPLEWTRPHMIPINLTYYNPLANGGTFNDPDVLTIVYKDQDTGDKIVYDLQNPKMEIYIVKPEYRDYEHMRDMIEMKYCDKYVVPYRTRWHEAAKILKLKSSSEAKMSPYVFNADIPVETYYLIQFVMEYPTDKTKELSLGKLDIENDIIRFDGTFPGYGDAPINAVTYINMDTDDVYTLILFKDDLPEVPPEHPKYAYYQSLKENLYRQADEIEKNPQMMLDKCHEAFDELYPGMKYNLLYYRDERRLLEDLMQIIHSTDNEYIGIWNSPYDMQNIMMRPAHLGMNPLELIPDDRFSIRLVGFKEDTNPQFHKRRHTCKTSTIPSFEDDMVLYSGIHSQGGVLPSHKLTFVAQKELKDDKYDYSEISDVAHLYYDDLIRFILYNIKDVLLLVGLERKTKGMDTIYSRLYQMFVFPREAFTTTKVVWHSLIKFMYDNEFVPGTNRNRGKHRKEIIDYAAKYSGKIEENDEKGIPFEEAEFEFDFDEPTLDESSEDGEEKDEKYQGAWIMNTLHMQPTSVTILGQPAKYVHDNVADSDVGSEYPSAINTCDISNETLVARVYLMDPDEVEIPIPEGFVFRGDDRDKYKMDKGNYLLETYTEEDPFNFATLWLGLPTPEAILSDLAKKVG